MIDHILVYPTAAARDASWPAPEGDPPSWTVDGRDVMPVRIVHERAVYGADLSLVSPEVVAPGAWLVVRTRDRDAELEAMPQSVIITDAARAAAGQPYVIKCTVSPQTVLGQVDPVWAGAIYAIPVGEPAETLIAWLINPPLSEEPEEEGETE